MYLQCPAQCLTHKDAEQSFAGEKKEYKNNLISNNKFWTILHYILLQPQLSSIRGNHQQLALV